MKASEILKQKTKDELIILARKLQLSRYSKLSKSALIKLILESKEEKLIIKEINNKGNPYRKIIFFLAPILLTLIIFFIQNKQSNKSTQTISEGQNNLEKTIVNEVQKLLNDKDYSRYIEQQEELNNALLENFFGDNFQVYGQRNNHLFRDSQTFESHISVEKTNNKEHLKLSFNLNDFNISTITGSNITSATFSTPKEEIKQGRLVSTGYNLGGHLLYLVMLNKDWTNPVYALGFIKLR